MMSGKAKYFCVTPCWHEGHKYRRGDEEMFSESEVPKDKEGNMVHFKRVNPAEPPPEKPAEGPVTVNEKKRPVR